MVAPSDAKYIVSASHAELDSEIVIPGLAEHADVSGFAGAGTSEEYDTSSTGLTWSATPDVENSNNTRISHLYVEDNSASEILGSKSWSPAGAFDARCKMAIGTEAAASPAFGLFVGTSGNTSRMLVELEVTNASAILEVGAYSFASSTYTQRSHTTYITSTNAVYLRMTRDGSNNFNCFWSLDGYAWISVMSSVFNFSITIANIGFRMNPNSVVTKAYVDWLRTDV